MRSLAYDGRYALNAICPYFTMFPLEYPFRVLKRFQHAPVEVMDPFCGRGTTLFAARTLGHRCRGIDSSPVAVAIARAKLSNATAEDALTLARLLLLSVKPKSVPEGEFFEWAYHRDTLRDICALREGLMAPADTDASVLLRAAVLGCLHGPLNKAASPSYLSNQMPRTFGPKPAYAVRYWRDKRMRPQKVDVLAVLQKKLALIESTVPLPRTRFSDVVSGDSTRLISFPRRRTFSVVITSPPYYGMQTYVQDQWLRAWFLGGPCTVDYGAGVQVSHAGKDAFVESLGRVWANMATTQAKTLDMFVRFGVIPSSKVDPRRLLRESLEASGSGMRVVSCRNASSALAGKRQAEQMGAGSGACDEYDFHILRD